MLYSSILHSVIIPVHVCMCAWVSHVCLWCCTHTQISVIPFFCESRWLSQTASLSLWQCRPCDMAWDWDRPRSLCSLPMWVRRPHDATTEKQSEVWRDIWGWCRMGRATVWQLHVQQHKTWNLCTCWGWLTVRYKERMCLLSDMQDYNHPILYTYIGYIRRTSSVVCRSCTCAICIPLFRLTVPLSLPVFLLI